MPSLSKIRKRISWSGCLAICALLLLGVASLNDEPGTHDVAAKESSAAPPNEPVVQTAQEESPAPADSPTVEIAAATPEDVGEIVTMAEVKTAPDATGRAAEKVAPPAAGPASRPLVQTARVASAARTHTGHGAQETGSGKIVAMRQVKRALTADLPNEQDAGETARPPLAVRLKGYFSTVWQRLAVLLIEMDPRAHLVREHELLPFSPDPHYSAPYDPIAQLDIYGAKHPNPTARPLIEAGRELYGPGDFRPGINLLGSKNLVFPQLLVYGDERTAMAYNDNGAVEKGLIATRLNLDIDLKITGTERIHLFITPLNRGAEFTRVEFAGDKRQSGVQIDLEPIALFFEGDLGRLAAGFSNRENRVDLPITFGMIPLLFQNGIWLNDAFLGFALTIPARNSPALGISNADITFFAGFDQVTGAAIPAANSSDIFGVASFVEAASGYFEFDYGYTLGRKTFDDLSYHNLSGAFTRRYFDMVSNSVRVIYNFGQEPDRNHRRTADGVLILIENSLITPLPLTLVPYFNLFAGFNKPQSLARAGAAGGVLVNTGIMFETDNLTGFPALDATGHDTYGGSLGIEYLFNLHQQIVFEFSGLNVFGDAKDRTTVGAQYGFGLRYQLPLNNAWLVRADFIAAAREHQEDLLGIRAEFRRKF